MNCKPGDLAVIVTTCGWRFCDNLLGRVVRVMKVEPNVRDEPAWHYEGPRLYSSRGDEAQGIPDAWLRPIRDPGDDARDETLQWLPVPSREQEAA